MNCLVLKLLVQLPLNSYPSANAIEENAKDISLDGVVFSKNESARTDTREKVNRLLDVSDEASLHFILSVLEALREKEQTGIK